MSLLGKVRFVASTLLDALSDPSMGVSDGTASYLDQSQSPLAERSRKAQSHLWEFLRILGEIEAVGTLS